MWKTFLELFLIYKNARIYGLMDGRYCPHSRMKSCIWNIEWEFGEYIVKWAFLLFEKLNKNVFNSFVLIWPAYTCRVQRYVLFFGVWRVKLLRMGDILALREFMLFISLHKHKKPKKILLIFRVQVQGLNVWIITKYCMAILVGLISVK